MNQSPSKPRLALNVVEDRSQALEILSGEQMPWGFRLHFHAADEQVKIVAGQARLHLRDQSYVLGAGDVVVVPARTIHRFEPVDAAGWAFESTFLAVERDVENLFAYVPRTAEIERIKLAALWGSHNPLGTQLNEIALQCGLSTGYLSRTFRAETGTSIHQYRLLLAIHRAKDMIRRGGNLVDVAVHAGFHDQAHMGREFIKTYGLTPGSYRAAWRQPRL